MKLKRYIVKALNKRNFVVKEFITSSEGAMRWEVILFKRVYPECEILVFVNSLWTEKYAEKKSQSKPT